MQTLWKVPGGCKTATVRQQVGEDDVQRRRTCTKEMDSTDLGTHFLEHDVLEKLPVDLKGLGVMYGRVGFSLASPVLMLEVPIPLQKGF